MTDQPLPLPDVDAQSRSFWRNLSVVWLVPLLALVVALGIAWQAYTDRGSLVEIHFENGAGVQAGETTLRYRDVVIGEVERVHFSEDLRTVIVDVRVENAILPFLDEDASFWVVRPEISAQGVSGLSTVVSGVYIEGAWDSDPGTATRSFIGLANPLFVRPGEEGRRITLNVSPGLQLQGGEPLIFRGLEVGRLETPRLVGEAMSAQVEAFVQAPYDTRISSATRFWDSSGFSIDFDSNGLSLDVESLASLVGGGIEFDEVYSNGEEIPDGLRFDIFTSEEAARASAFVADIVGEVPVSVQFINYTRGLRPGLVVQMDGVRIGQISAVTVHSFETPTGMERRHVASLLLDATAMGLPEGSGPAEVYEFLADAVDDGLRARLLSAGLITADFRMDLAVMISPDPASFDRTAAPFPRIPAISTQRPTVNATAEGVLERVAALPFERLLTQAIDTLASIETLAGDQGLQEVQQEVVSLLSDARGLITNEDTQAIPGTAFAAMDDLRAVLAELRESGSIAALTSVLAQADTAMGSITEASVDLPALLENLSTLSATAAALDLDTLVASASSVLANADSFLSSEELADVPPALSAAMADLETLLAELNAADVAGSLTATLASANAVLVQADTAMGPLTDASVHLPALLENLATLSETTAALELEALVTSASTVLATADTFLSGEDLASVPPALSAAMSNLEILLADLTEADVVGSLTTTLASADAVLAQADTAMGPITEASALLPGMVENFAALSETAAALEIEALVTSAATVLAAADTFLSDEDLAAVPPALSSALAELETLLADLTAADVVSSLNATLESTEAAANELPGLVTQTEAVLAQIGALSSVYGTRSAFLTEAMDVLREITSAARSIAQLARTIERNPNSLLTGR